LKCIKLFEKHQIVAKYQKDKKKYHNLKFWCETRRIKTIRQEIGYGDEFRKGCLIAYPQFYPLFNFISYIFYLERFE